jgi:hypothetical protein
LIQSGNGHWWTQVRARPWGRQSGLVGGKISMATGNGGEIPCRDALLGVLWSKICHLMLK